MQSIKRIQITTTNSRGRHAREERFRRTIDVIGGIFHNDMAETCFRASRFLYPLFLRGIPHEIRIAALGCGKETVWRRRISESCDRR